MSSQIELRDMKYAVLNTTTGEQSTAIGSVRVAPQTKLGPAVKTTASGFNFGAKKRESQPRSTLSSTSSTTVPAPVGVSFKMRNGSSFSTIDSWPSKVTLNGNGGSGAGDVFTRSREKSTFLFFPPDRRYSHVSMDDSYHHSHHYHNHHQHNSSQQEPEIKLSSLLISLLRRCKKSKNDASASASGRHQQPIANSQAFKLYFQALFLRFIRFCIGLGFTLLICVSFNMTIYLLRRAFNVITIVNTFGSRFSTSTTNQTTLASTTKPNMGAAYFRRRDNGIYAFDLTIETNRTQTSYESSCNFCYFFVWLVTSCLSFAYPIYLALYFVFYCSHIKTILKFTKSTSNKTTSNASTSSTSPQSQKQSGVSNVINTNSNQPNQTTNKSDTTNTPTTTTTINNNKINTNTNTTVTAATTTAAAAATSTAAATPAVLITSAKPLSKCEKLSLMFTSSFNIFDSFHQYPPHYYMGAKAPSSEPGSGTNATSGTAKLASRSKKLLIRRRDFVAKITGITFVWTMTGFAFLKALDFLNCLDVVILFSVNFSFVYMAAWIVLHNLFIPLRLLGFILSIAALIFTYYSDGFQFDFKFLGNVCATAAAAGTATLQVIWRNVTKNKTNNHRTMLLTLIGIFNLILGWPLILLLKVSNIETLSLFNASSYPFVTVDQSIRLLTYLVIASVLGLVYVIIMLFGHLVTDDIYIKVGSFLIIPVSAIIDITVNHVDMSNLKIGALISICIGYIFLILPENLYKKLSKKFCSEQAEPIESHNSLTRRYRNSTLQPSSSNYMPSAQHLLPQTQPQPQSKLAATLNSLQSQLRTSNLSISNKSSS